MSRSLAIGSKPTGAPVRASDRAASWRFPAMGGLRGHCSPVPLRASGTDRCPSTPYGLPASALTDNGSVYTSRFTHGHNDFERLRASLGITQKDGHPGHPQTQGKICERFHQTLKRWLTPRPRPTTEINQLQALLDTFRQRYNTARPHGALPQGRTPQQAYTALPEVIPTATTTHIFRIRHGTVDQFGKLTLRHGSRLSAVRPHAAGARTHSSLMPMRACSRASCLGAHQFHWPRTCMNAGSSTIRTRVASTSTAMVSPRPNTRMKDTCAAINAANEMDIPRAAAVTTRPVRARPSATLSSLSACVWPDLSQYSLMRDTRNTS